MNKPPRPGLPLYRRVADDIAGKVKAGELRPGDRLPSERALCDAYHVSQITIRRALRELSHAGRVYSHHGLGWFVAEQPIGTSHLVAVITTHLDWPLPPVLQHTAASLATRGLGLQLLLAEDADSAAAAALAAAEQGAVAVLWALPAAPPPPEVSGELSVPLMLLLGQEGDGRLPWIGFDERQCTERLTRHLLSLGHHRLAYVGQGPAAGEERHHYWGFAATLWEHGLELPLEWVFAGPLTDQESGARLQRVVQGPDGPTALVCSSDLRAAEAMRALAAAGLRCPEDVAIVGVGDREFCSLLPTPLTTVRYDVAAVGRKAGATIATLLAGGQAESVRIPGELVTRSSCGCNLAKSARQASLR